MILFNLSWMYHESNLFISFVGTSTCGNTINEDSWTFLVQCMFGYMHDYLQRMVALKMMHEWFNTMNGRVHEYPPTCIGCWPLNFLCTYSAKRHLLKCPFTPWPNLDKAIGIPCIHQPSSTFPYSWSWPLNIHTAEFGHHF